MGSLAPAYFRPNTECVPAKRKQDAEPELVLLEEAAAAVGLHPQTVLRYRRDGLLTKYRTKRAGRRRVMVDLAELRALKERPPIELED